MKNTNWQFRNQLIPGWYWAHNQMIDEVAPRVGVYAVAVYHLLCRHARQHRVKGWSLAMMSTALGCGRTSIIEGLTRLEAHGAIGCERTSGSETEYLLLDLTHHRSTGARDLHGAEGNQSAMRTDVVRGTNQRHSPGERLIRKENEQYYKTKTPPNPLLVVEHALGPSQVADAVMSELGFSGGRLNASLSSQAKFAIEREGKTGEQTIADMVGAWRLYTSSTEYKRVSMGALNFFSQGKWREGRDDPNAWMQLDDGKELLSARTKRNIAAVKQAQQFFLERGT